MRLILIFSVIILSSTHYTNSAAMNAPLPTGTIVELFKNFNDLSDSIKTIMLENGECYPASNTSEDVKVYRMTIDSSNNSIRVKMFFEQGGDSGIETIEYKCIQIKNEMKFIRSTVSGTISFISQDEFQIFNYNFSSKKFELETDSSQQKNLKIEIGDFFHKKTPDSIIQEYRSHSTNYFILQECDNCIAKNILVENLIFNSTKDNKWIRGDTIKFYFKGNKFMRSNPYFEY